MAKKKNDSQARERVEKILAEMEQAATRAHHRGADGELELFRMAAACVRGELDRYPAAAAVVLAFNDCMRAWKVEKWKAERARALGKEGPTGDVLKRHARFEQAKKDGSSRSGAAIWRLLAQQDLPNDATQEQIKSVAGSYARTYRKHQESGPS
jgi:hypothetical protein